jgi:hypothetical protein
MTSLKPAAARLAVAVCLSLTTLGAGARAASVTYSGTYGPSPYLGVSQYNFPVQSVPQFDLPGQCLSSVCVQATAHGAGFLSFENIQTFPTTVTSSYEVQVTLRRPDLSPIMVLQPLQTFSDPVTSYDGVADYAGTSGVTHSGLDVSASNTVCLASALDLALFTGAGTVNLPCTAFNMSTQFGANSWSIGLQAYVSYSVTYNYMDCGVPAEQTTWGNVKSMYR